MPRLLAPLSQHHSLVDWLRTEERVVWNWFSEKDRLAADEEQVRLSLLRDTYRMEEEGHPEVFREVEAARAALGMDTSVYLYQAQGGSQPNASICYLPGEAHLIFEGPILSLLSPEELRAIIGHELAHYFFWQSDGGAFLLADRILDASAAHPAAHASHLQSARVWRLATELFADRGAFLASGSLETAVSALVKTTTGLSHISAKSYLAQATEIFSKSRPKTNQLSHPETFIRARALQLWVEEEPSLEGAIAAMLDFDEGLDGLTLVRQAELGELTRRFLGNLLQPDWFQSDAALAHARLFFRDFSPASEADTTLVAELAELPVTTREYFCQVMLDFCAVNADMHDQPIVRCLEMARGMECLGAFEKLLAKELKVKAKDLKKLKELATR